jgi:hypothetical protein
MDITFKVNKDSLTKVFFYSFLIAGYLNTVLRPAPESDLSLFRILLPIAFFFYCYSFTPAAIRCGAIIAVFLCYGLICSFFISRFENFNFIYFLHYATIMIIASVTFSLINRLGIQSVYNHLRFVYKIMIALAVFQFFTDFEFPNTEYLGTLNIYYWVNNDFASALAAFIPFLLLAPDKKLSNAVFAGLGVAIVAYNGSRIALLSILFFLLFISLNRLKTVGYVLASIVGLGLFLYFKDYKLGGDTLSQLIVDPFKHIATLSPYERTGSIYDRTNALIFGIKELLSTGGFGIGPGNATAMLELPEYFLISAKSMHNFIAQIFVEYGWLMLFTIIFALYKAYNYRRRAGIKSKHDAKLYIYLVTAALASLSQSEGLFTNYYFFVALFSSFAYFGNYSQNVLWSNKSNEIKAPANNIRTLT